MTFETYWLYLAAVAVFFASPPDTSQLLIITNCIQHGLRKSMFTIAGDLSANCIQMTTASFGLAAIIATSATAFLWIKWLGVAYLAWIGVQLIRTRTTGTVLGKSPGGTPSRLFRQGFLTSMANPYAVVFFGALFPHFLNAETAVLPQLLILGTTYLVVDGSILLFWGWSGYRAAAMIKTASLGLINKICGALMIAAAVLLASKDMSTIR